MSTKDRSCRLTYWNIPLFGFVYDVHGPLNGLHLTYVINKNKILWSLAIAKLFL